MTRSPDGSWLIGKNTPEKRNSGISPRRKISGNASSFSWWAAKAASGAANAMPTSTPAGKTARVSMERVAWNAAITTR